MSATVHDTNSCPDSIFGAPLNNGGMVGSFRFPFKSFMKLSETKRLPLLEPHYMNGWAMDRRYESAPLKLGVSNLKGNRKETTHCGLV